MFQERPTGPGYKVSLLISAVLVVLLLTLHFTGVKGLVKGL
ncbi:hypothetical protein BpOF4_21699 (plasmid) [Alkalihalophilus pseudofirmus OF4]|uniref:Uncharacterized protein n=1 Tax=Alkalihalophilus pseudofirmus (strain ATCC BAA-2126 / JCM 17055 / OF4) TaxID=398511 RepID=D3G1V9_ALKPO|nr:MULTISPECIES: hypothetical protein [Alkalihalophilus]ADC52335.1 hypothetical protein BpOF4_21699 [Alkalihalophilus pseudofirmus OF4]MED1603668.1 hypothetical protein [Alkalihalophilus marmarensis]